MILFQLSLFYSLKGDFAAFVKSKQNVRMGNVHNVRMAMSHIGVLGSKRPWADFLSVDRTST
jgi:hypothetical protein